MSFLSILIPAKKKVILRECLNVGIFLKSILFSRYICLNYNSNVLRFCITESSPQRVKVEIWDYHTDSFPKHEEWKFTHTCTLHSSWSCFTGLLIHPGACFFTVGCPLWVRRPDGLGKHSCNQLPMSARMAISKICSWVSHITDQDIWHWIMILFKSRNDVLSGSQRVYDYYHKKRLIYKSQPLWISLWKSQGSICIMWCLSYYRLTPINVCPPSLINGCRSCCTHWISKHSEMIVCASDLLCCSIISI